jgi:hypothetical protein
MPHHSGDAGDADQEQDRPGGKQESKEAKQQFHGFTAISRA